MKEILKQILKGDQLSFTCILLPTGEWLGGKLQSVNDEVLIFENSLNRTTGRYWTTVVKIDCIQAIDFRSDTRDLTTFEKKEQGLPIMDIDE